MYRVLKAVIENNREWLKGWLFGQFGVEPADELIDEWIKLAQQISGFPKRDAATVAMGIGWAVYQWTRADGRVENTLFERYTDDDMRLWFSNRLRETGAWPKVGCDSDNYPRYAMKFHVFFISVDETEEQLRLLRNESKTKSPRGPSTPGIERTMVMVQPIDRVAARVTREAECT